MEPSKRNNSNHHSNNSRKKQKNQTPEGNFRDELHLCSKAKDLCAAISLYDSAGSKNIRLNHYHFNVFLYICSNAVSDLSDNQYCARNSAFEFGFRIFDRMLAEGVKPTEATITALARLAAAKGDGDRAFDLVKSMAKYGLTPRLRSYESALMCYCRNLQAEKAYEIEDNMGSMGVALEEPELAALLNVSAETRNGEKVYEYLHKLRVTARSVTDTTAEAMERWFGGEAAAEVGFGNLDEGLVKEAILKNGGGWHGLGWFGKGRWVTHRSKMDIYGCCISCGQQLDSVDIDTEETVKFAESLASLALEREAHSNFKEFQDWLDAHADYEAIVDGANIGLYQQNFAEGGFSISQLDAVVQEVYKRSKKWPLVVLHSRRIPLLQENESNRGIVEKWLAQGILYGTPYGSNDDWYWLYAAVKLKCLLVTNDEMRDHIFELLGSSFFLRWKERHQVRYTFLKGVLKLQMPPSYSVVIQESGKGSWHVPLAGDHEDECSRSWLCFSRQGYSEKSDQISAAATKDGF